MRDPPPGWSLNALTDSFDLERENQYATFDNKPAAKVDLVNVDKLLRKLVSGHIDPKPWVPLQFLLRSHSCFRAAAGSAMAGQVYEATVLMRAALESAAYGLHINTDDSLATLWFSRSDSKGATERVRTEFSYGNMKRGFKAKYPRVAPAFTNLYEALIDFGGHPNEAGFSISTAIRKEPGKRLIDTIYLHGDGLPLDFGLKNAARVGVWAALAFREIYPSYYDALGVDEVVVEFTNRL